MPIDIAAYIDHTALKQSTTGADIDRLCVEASTSGFKAVCVPPKYIVGAKRLLNNSDVKVATVISFPMGYSATRVKLKEIKDAIFLGADELDMVIDLCALKSGDWEHLKKEIEVCLEPIQESGKVIKLIVESGLLTKNELINCCKIYREYDIHFLKTSTGFSEIGASVQAVEIMRQHLPENIGIKASGGVRSYSFAKELIDAGATRIGTSNGLQILKEYNEMRDGVTFI